MENEMYVLFSGTSPEDPFETLEDKFDDEQLAIKAAEPFENRGLFCAVMPVTLARESAVYLTADPE